MTISGAIKTAAKRIGIDRDEYLRMIKQGKKWCSGCKEWHHYTAFGADNYRSDGLATMCFDYRKKLYNRTYIPRERTVGKKITSSRAGDRRQAVGRISHLVNVGLLPHPDTLKCSKCGGERKSKRNEYHHFNGYAPEHHEDVIVLCSACHGQEHSKTHCVNGHEFTPENTYTRKNGTKMCRECARVRDRERVRPPGYWKKINEKRRGRGKGQ